MLHQFPISCLRLKTVYNLQWRLLTTSSAEKPFYVTTPIFYPNAVPHIGHLYSLVIADVISRYQRLSSPTRPVKFLTGTDEHGLKIQKAALAKKMAEKHFCDELSEQFRRLAQSAQVNSTVFMRTTSKEHHGAVEDVWRKLDAKGLIYKGSYAGWYSVTDECFYTDGQVTTITASPYTDSAPTTIATETCSAVEWSEEHNYMFRLSSFRDALLEHYTAPSPGTTILPNIHHSRIISVLKNEELEDLSISRPRARLSWGIPVPGDPDHTVYVWFDALLVYLSGIGYPWKGGMQEGLKNGWPVDLQVIGKDILRFHAIYLPAILLALGLPLQQRILAHAHWTSRQKKMSKSLGNVADPFAAIETFGIDVVRFYLTRVGGRFRDDVDWSQEQLSKHSKEIQSLLGNYFLRITSARLLATAASAPPLTLSAVAEDTSSPNSELLQASQRLAEEVGECMEKLELGEGLDKIIELLRLANKVLTDIAPWSSTSPSTILACYLAATEVLRVSGICLQPFVPEVAGKLLDALRIAPEDRMWDHATKLKKEGPEKGVQGVRLFTQSTG